MDDQPLETRIALVERDQQTAWRRIDELTKADAEHGVEDDKRFEAVADKLDKLNTRFTSILASICVLCLSLCINAAVIVWKVHP